MVAMALTLTGCAGGLEFAAIGAAANATRAGSAVVKGGKISGAVLAPADAVNDAVRLALDDADMRIKTVDTRRTWRTEYVAKDDRGAKVKVRVKERTDKLSRVQVDVGWFGDAATARLVSLRVQYHLRQNGHADENGAITDDDDREDASDADLGG